MKINFTPNETELLRGSGIDYDAGRDYSEDEALELLETVRDAEVSYAQETDAEGTRLYNDYCRLGDKIAAMIPG